MMGNEGAGSEVEDQAAVDLGVEGKIKIIQRLLRIAELSLFAASFQEAIAAPKQLVRDQAGHQVEGSHGIFLRLEQPGFQDRSHTSQPELAQSTIEFDQVHEDCSFRCCSMKSRYCVSSRIRGST